MHHPPIGASDRGRGTQRSTRVALAICALLLAAPPAPALRGQGAASSLTRDQIRDFLQHARIVKSKAIPIGVTRPVRLTLSDGTITHDAAFSAVDEHRSVERFASGRVELDFVDSYKYSLAAYKVAELLGLEGMMPVHVERTWDGQKGALAWWVDAQMDEGARLKNRVRVPDPAKWNEQMYRMRVFSQLVADSDRNVGNILIDADWNLWMIDFTRAFRRTRTLLSASDLTKCDRRLLEKLRALTAEQVAAATRPYLGGAEVEPLMIRRDLIVALFEKLVAEKGDAQVLY
jgi:hypothetical protein